VNQELHGSRRSRQACGWVALVIAFTPSVATAEETDAAPAAATMAPKPEAPVAHGTESMVPSTSAGRTPTGAPTAEIRSGTPTEQHKIALSTGAVDEPKCEPCERDKDAVEGAGAFLVGAGLFDFSSLNNHLAANGYDRLSSVMPIIGGEGHAVFTSGFVAGAHGGGLLGASGHGPGVRTRLSGGFGMVDLGFAPVRTRDVLFSITGGIGGYGLSLGIGDDQSASFDSVLAKPGRSVSLSQGGLLVGLRLGLDFRVPVGHVERGRRGFFTLGVRVAGLYGPPIGDWQISEGGKATDGPPASLTGGYAALAIGFGGGSVRAPGIAAPRPAEDKN
jgi:hypothetical protein